jgi:hypothetical protein
MGSRTFPTIPPFLGLGNSGKRIRLRRCGQRASWRAFLPGRVDAVVALPLQVRASGPVLGRTNVTRPFHASVPTAAEPDLNIEQVSPRQVRAARRRRQPGRLRTAASFRRPLGSRFAAEAVRGYPIDLRAKTKSPRWPPDWWYRHEEANVANPFYPRLHINQLTALDVLAPDPRLADAARRFAGYERRPVINFARTCTRKALFCAVTPRSPRLAGRWPWRVGAPGR